MSEPCPPGSDDAQLVVRRLFRHPIAPCRNTDHSAARVAAACLKSLAALRLSYLDLYLIHWPVTGNVGPEVLPSIRETWQAMEALVREGRVRSIGVSNFSVRKMEQLLRYATIPLSVCQVGGRQCQRCLA